jgi:hypothetical protein
MMPVSHSCGHETTLALDLHTSGGRCQLVQGFSRAYPCPACQLTFRLQCIACMPIETARGVLRCLLLDGGEVEDLLDEYAGQGEARQAQEGGPQ